MLLQQAKIIPFWLTWFLVSSTVFSITCGNLEGFNKTWETQLNFHDVIDLLNDTNKRGGGAYGRIFEIPWYDPKTKKTSSIAIKKSRNFGTQQEFRDEINFLDFANKKKFKYVPMIIACFYYEEGYYMALEYLAGSLEPFTAEKFSSEIKPNMFFFNNYYKQKPKDRLRIMREIALGLFELHKERIVHNDVKPENIMAKNSQLTEIRLIDFNFITLDDEPSQFGTQKFFDLQKRLFFEDLFVFSEEDEPKISPESQKDNWKADIWAFGLSLFELEMPNSRKVFDLLNETYPFKDGYQKLREHIIAKEWIEDRELHICNKVEKFCFRDILIAMTQVERSEREITAKEIARKLTLLIGDQRNFGYLFDKPSSNGFGGDYIMGKLTNIKGLFGFGSTSPEKKLVI